MKPPTCPRCGEEEVAAILYGYPDPDAFEELSQDPYVLFAGCLVEPRAPVGRCRACGAELTEDELTGSGEG